MAKGLATSSSVKREVTKMKKEVDEIKETVRDAVHKIHGDGTYTNGVLKHKIDPAKHPTGSFISVAGPYPLAGWVYHVDENGMRIRTTKDRLPDLSECPYRTWEYISKHLQKG